MRVKRDVTDVLRYGRTCLWDSGSGLSYWGLARESPCAGKLDHCSSSQTTASNLDLQQFGKKGDIGTIRGVFMEKRRVKPAANALALLK